MIHIMEIRTKMKKSTKTTARAVTNMAVPHEEHAMLTFLQRFIFRGKTLQEVHLQCLRDGFTRFFEAQQLSKTLCLLLREYSDVICGKKVRNINLIVAELFNRFLRARRKAGKAEDWENELFADSKDMELMLQCEIDRIDRAW